MARSLGVAVLLLLGTPAAFAQPLVIPGKYNPGAFSNIAGKYTIMATAEPTDVEVEQAITLRVQIVGAGPKEFEPNRKYLDLFPESWKSDFYVQPMQDKDEVDRDTKTWTFFYRLKPKHVNVKALDEIKLVYYDPSSPEKIKYITRYVKPTIEINVKPKTDQSLPKELDVLAAPASFYQQAESSRVLAGSTSFAISRTQLVLFLTLTPLACLIGALAWRRCFPDEARRARRHRDSSAARAFGLLQSANVPAWDVMRRYLRERFDFPARDATPADVAMFLKRRGFAKLLCEQARAFFHASDGARFSVGVIIEHQPLAADAVHLIQALEADPCARG